MMARIPAWLAPASSDPDIARQEYLLNQVLVTLTITGALYGLGIAVVWGMGQASPAGAIAGFAVLPFYALAYWLGRHGQVRLGTYLTLAVLLLIMLAATYELGIGHATLVGFAMLTVTGVVLLGIQSALFATLVSAIAYAALGVMQRAGNLPRPLPSGETVAADTITIVFGLFAVSVLVWLSRRETERALHQVRRAQDQAQRYTEQLGTIQGQLERQVEERTQDLRSFAEQLQISLDEQQRLWETVQRISIPIVPVHEGIIVMPLVGHIDAHRAERMVDDLLLAIEEEKAKLAIIDITGVPVVDSQVASTLIQAVNAAKLMGAESVLVGIRPEVADTVIRLGLDLSGMTIQRDLQAGVNYAMARVAPNPLQDADEARRADR
jgi:rsbT co-antagonist protein RsbR